MVPIIADGAQYGKVAEALPVFAIAAFVVVCSAAGAAADVWKARRQQEEKQVSSAMPRFWVLGMLASSYMVLIPGLVSHLFTSRTDLIIFGMPQNMSEYDENMVSLIGRLGRDHMYAGAIFVTLYAIVVPVMKLVLLALGQYWQRGGPQSVRRARWCILVVQLVSKWASPDMFAYVLLGYLLRSLNKPPNLKSGMSLDLGFTCFCVFCVGSTVSSLGVHVPKAPREVEVTPVARYRCPGALRIVFVLALTAAFACLLAVGLTSPSMSLFLDMDLLYKVKPELVAYADILNGLQLGDLLQVEVSVWTCMGALCEWVQQGEANSLIALIMYAGFALLLPIVDMALLLFLTVLDLHRSSLPNVDEWSSRVLTWSRMIRKLSMLDVSVMGCFVVVLTLKAMREKGVVVKLCWGWFALLGAELCHHAAAFLSKREHRLAAAVSKAAEGPQKEVSPQSSQDEEVGAVEVGAAAEEGESV